MIASEYKHVDGSFKIYPILRTMVKGEVYNVYYIDQSHDTVAVYRLTEYKMLEFIGIAPPHSAVRTPTGLKKYLEHEGLI